MTFNFDKFRADMLARIDQQFPRNKAGGFTAAADRAALEMLCGAAMALAQADPVACGCMIGWAFLCSARGLSFLPQHQDEKEAA